MLPCFKDITLNSTILLNLSSPVIFGVKLTSEVCGFLIMSRDISVEPRDSMLSVFILIRSIRLVDINTN